MALTRRVGEELAHRTELRDKSLVRHVYDLHASRPHYDPAELTTLAADIAPADAEAYGHNFCAYREDPIRETLKAVKDMAGDGQFASQYAAFVRDMVYGDRPEFRTAMSTIEELAEHLRLRS